MILHIKNMVCLHCILALKQLLKELDIPYSHVELGAIYLAEKLPKEKLDELANGLQLIGNKPKFSKAAFQLKSDLKIWVKVIYM